MGIKWLCRPSLNGEQYIAELSEAGVQYFVLLLISSSHSTCPAVAEELGPCNKVLQAVLVPSAQFFLSWLTPGALKIFLSDFQMLSFQGKDTDA